jgi:hypothetical protein
MRNVYKILVVKPKEELPLERDRHKLEGNMKMDCKEIECESVD